MLAIIPARGGSKGLPGKNIRLLNGLPLISYAIRSAIQSKLVTRVICSTDDEDIAKVALSYGAEVPFLRPDFLARDDSLAIDNYLYTIDRLISEGAEIKEFCVLLPTSPLRTAEDIDSAISLFYKKNADSVISFYKAPHPIGWHRFLTSNGVLVKAVPDGDGIKNRQSEESTYIPNGAIYVFNYESLKCTKQYYTQNTYAYLMESIRSVDIDSLEDFEYAEFLLNKNSAKSER